MSKTLNIFTKDSFILRIIPYINCIWGAFFTLFQSFLYRHHHYPVKVTCYLVHLAIIIYLNIAIDMQKLNLNLKVYLWNLDTNFILIMFIGIRKKVIFNTHTHTHDFILFRFTTTEYSQSAQNRITFFNNFPVGNTPDHAPCHNPRLGSFSWLPYIDIVLQVPSNLENLESASPLWSEKESWDLK